MPQAIEPPTRTLPLGEPSRFRWSVPQYENLFSMGLLPNGSYELLNGDVVEKMPTRYPHAHVVTLFFALFSRFYGFPFLLTQSSLYIDDENLPEPDFTVLKSLHPTLTDEGHVGAEDVQTVIEVSDTTLNTDLTTRAILYARAGIPEYWVVDVSGRRLLIHDTPATDGYASVTEYTETESAVVNSVQNAAFSVADILP
ncbi:MAG: Uma2 family endonuclease [Armatimonadaceae bacterium]